MDPGTVGLALSFSLQVTTLTLVVTMATEPEKKCYNQITVIPGVVFEFLTPPFHKKKQNYRTKQIVAPTMLTEITTYERKR